MSAADSPVFPMRPRKKGQLVGQHAVTWVVQSMDPLMSKELNHPVKMDPIIDGLRLRPPLHGSILKLMLK